MTWIAGVVLHLTGPVVLIADFTLPALEASTLLGIVVPGEFALVLGGVLAHQGRVSLLAAIAAGAAGAVAGDSIGYAVGRRFGDRLLDRLPRRLRGRRHLERAMALARRHGGRAVFVGRFTTGVRALVPGLAGLAQVPYRTFVAFNAAGGLLWATGSVLLGFAAGQAYRAAERIAGQAGLIVFGAIVVGAAAGRVMAHRRGRAHHTG